MREHVEKNQIVETDVHFYIFTLFRSYKKPNWTCLCMYKKSGLSVDGCQPYLCDDLYPRRDVILGTCPVKGRVHHKRRKTAKKRFKNTWKVQCQMFWNTREKTIPWILARVRYLKFKIFEDIFDLSNHICFYSFFLLYLFVFNSFVDHDDL